MSVVVSPWPGLALVERVAGGHRNEVWKGSLGGRRVAVRRSRRTQASLAWELDVLALLGRRGLHVPTVVPTTSGAPSHDGVVVQEWIEGREPSSAADWRRVAAVLERLHATCADVGQRPGCRTVTELRAAGPASRSIDADLAAMPPGDAELVLSVFASMADAPVSLIHGDPGASNIRIDDPGEVWLLDWDESRVDVAWHDLSNLGVQVLPDPEHAGACRLSNAWEAANAWLAEPEYARRRLAALRSDAS